jgi:mRNA interferase HigB
MRIISFRKLREFYEAHPESKTALKTWYAAVRKSDWRNFADLRRTFGDADVYKKCTIFDIAGNKYRLIAWVNYKTHAVYIRHVLTHTDYGKDKWKTDCGSG